MKKILHVSYSMDTGGGPLTIKRIVEDFDQYEYFVAGNTGVYMEHFSKKLPISNLLYLQGMNLPLNLFLLCRFCFKYNIDILHVHGRGAASFGRFVKIFKPSIKIIYTPNGFFPDSLNSIKRFFYLLLERLLFLLTDYVFFVSLSEQKTFSDSIPGLNTSKFMYIQNYLTPTAEYLNPMPYKHTSDAKVNFLFIGRLSHQKGIDILLESLKRLVSLDFHVVIIGYGELEEYLLSEIKLDVIKDKVTYLGKIHEAFRLMPNFDALLLPSRFEGLPFTILEAMWFKLPLIVTPANGIVDLISNENGYMSSAIDSDAYADKIRLFVDDFTNNKNKIDKFVSENYFKLITEYSKDAVAAKINTLYS